jgi:pyrimidine-nucleoside phosphorylase
MTGQTVDVVPADRLLYALRDVTGTVESIPLITASILSKKKAEGAEALVLDVKYGSGAFMKDPAEGEGLARALVDTGAVLGLRVMALLTDMDQPLGRMVGNFLEVEECYCCLDPAAWEGGDGVDSGLALSADLMELCLELGARMLMLGGKAGDSGEGRRLCREALAGGEPRERFLANIETQGGDREGFLAMVGRYRSPYRGEIRAREDGYIGRIDAWKVGHAGIGLGVGRNRSDEAVSPCAGIEFHRKAGAAVRRGDLIMTVWGKDPASLEGALPALEGAVEYAALPLGKRARVLREIRQG